jgi:fatty-acyl-CoA synthase
MGVGSGTGAGSCLPVSRRVMNLAQFVAQSARRFPDRPALIQGERHWSWTEFDTRVSAMAAVLADHGIGSGDRVVVQSKNSNLMLESMWACFRIGAVWVPTNFRLLPDDVAYLATASGARALLCGGEFPDHAAAVIKAVPSMALVTRMGLGPLDAPDLDALMASHIGADYPAAAVEYDHPCWFISTSGTTGRPKLAVLTHGQMAFIVTNHLADLVPGTTEDDCCLVVAPLSHGAGNHGLTQVARGATTVLLPTERFDPAEVWRLVAEHRVTNMFTVPTIVKLLVEHPSVDTNDHSSLRHVVYAGAPMYRADQKRALAKLGPVLVQYFGLSEVTGCITVLPPALHVPGDGADARAGTCGIPRTGVDIQVQNPETGASLPAGETGEICVCGLAVFAGYYDNPEANAKAFRNGWFRTGDLGHQDVEGFLFITGRASDMYISGGSNVYPREIEEVLLTHPDILEVAVLGVPDQVWGETGVAVAVLRPEGTLDEAGLLAWLEGRVARYKQPRRAFFLADLPKSGYGKVTKLTIRQELMDRGWIAAPTAKVSA